MTRLLILDRSVRAVFHALQIGSLYLLFAGHNQPGGGFVGGLVAGAAVALRYVAGGIDDVRRLSRVAPWTILGTGLLVAAGTAMAPIVLGHDVLESTKVSWTVPGLGTVALSSPLVFDAGVYLLVVGLVLMVFEAFGDDPLPPSAGESA